MSTLVLRKESNAIALVLDGRRAVEFGWRAGRDVCDALRPHARGDSSEETQVFFGSFTLSFMTHHKLIEGEEDMVLCVGNGQLLFDAPRSKALEIWRGLCSHVRQLEEEDHAEQIAFDGALLLRTNAPFGLTDNPKIQREIAKEAGHNRTLRRALPGGVRGLRILGAPRIFNDTRTPRQRMAALIAKAGSAERLQIRQLLM